MEIEKMVREAFNNYHKSVVQIIKRTDKNLSVSSGFIIGKKESSYLVMTCRHCVTVFPDPAVLTLNVRISGKTTEYGASVLHVDRDSDLAIIQVMDVATKEECPILQFHSLLEAASANTSLVQIGYLIPATNFLNLEPSAAPGTIIKPLEQNGPKGIQDVVFQAATKHGFSGCPLLLDSKVIGVVYTTTLNGHTAYARSSNTVGMVLKKWLHIAPDAHLTIDQMMELMLTNI